MKKIELKNKLVELCLKETDNKVKPNDNLKSAGVDSLALVSLIVAIEEAFEISFDDSDLEPKNLNTLNDILKIVEKYLWDYGII